MSWQIWQQIRQLSRQHFCNRQLRKMLYFINSIIKNTYLTDWFNYSNPYKLINNNMTRLQHPASVNSRESQISTRLGLSQSILTHQHLLSDQSASGCPFRNFVPLSTSHILDDCPSVISFRRQLFGENTPSESLKEPTNISNFYNFIKLCNLQNLI